MRTQSCIKQDSNSPSGQAGQCIFSHPFHIWSVKKKERKRKRIHLHPSEKDPAWITDASGWNSESWGDRLLRLLLKELEQPWWRQTHRKTAPSCHYEMFCLCIAPVASLSSWQQQPGLGCAGARCMLGDYMHQRLDSTQLCVLDDRRRAQVSQTQRFFRAAPDGKGAEVLTPQIYINIDVGEYSCSSENRWISL